MRKVMIGVMLASMSCAGLAADGNWPFVAVRSYGTLKANARFTERLLAAQRRHPGLVDEVWPGCPARRAAIGTNKFARLVEDLPYLARCRELGIAVGWQYSTVGHGCDGRYGDFADSDWIVNSKGELKPGILCMTSPAARAEFRSFAEAVLRIASPDSLWPDGETFPVKLAIRRPAKSAWRVSAPMGDVAASVQPGRDGELIVSMPSLPPSSAFLIH